MRRYMITRVLQNVLTFFLYLTLVYILIDAQPGDYSDQFLNDPRLTPELRAQLRANLGLDKPVMVRYFIWMKNAFKGDFGISFSNYPRQVLDVIKERAPRTIMLFLSAILLSYLIGFASGKVLAWKRGGAVEYGATIGGVGLYTVFLPWFALMMVWFWGYVLGWFPIGKFLDPVLWRGSPVDANYVFNRMLITGFLAGIAIFVWLLYVRTLDPGRRTIMRWSGIVVVLAAVLLYWLSTGVSRYAADILHHLILPIVTLATVNFAGTMLLTRNSMLETLREDYIMAARAKGLPEKVVRDKHASRNALLPVVTAFVLAVAFILDGGVITETIFSWPGMGLTLLNAALVQDIPMVIGALVFTGILALSGHLIADILYAVLDPRIRYS
jgi:peptide/nickel transport system permease protein